MDSAKDASHVLLELSPDRAISTESLIYNDVSPTSTGVALNFHHARAA
jgi:hypothetical protein